MTNESQKSFIPQGVLSVNTNYGAIDSLRAHKPMTLQEINSNAILSENAFFIKKVNNWGISAKFPTSQYSEPSIMTVASPIFQESEVSKKTFLIYDAPESVQEEYWKMTTTLLNKISNFTFQQDHPLSKSIIVLTGHHCRQRQADGNPSARTIMAHHDHIMIIPPKLSGEAYDAADFGLPSETDLYIKKNNSELPYFLKNFVSFIRDSFKVETTIHKEKPVGYTFNIKNDPLSVSQTLNQHFKAYKTAMESSEYLERSYLDKDISKTLSQKTKYDSKKGRVIQPSFVLYLVPHQETIQAIISPMLVGIGGPERAGIKLEKSPDKPKKFSQEEYQRIINDIQSIL